MAKIECPDCKEKVDFFSHKCPKAEKEVAKPRFPFEFRKPLAKDAHKTLMATRPWEAEGVSRRTWYRRAKGK